MRMMDSTLKFCDKVTNRETYSISKDYTKSNEYIYQVLGVDIVHSLLENLKVPAEPPKDCPTEDVGTKINYVQDPEEADKLVTAVRHYFEARRLRYFFYFPSFSIFCIVLFCGFCFIIIKIGHIIFIDRRDKKR